MRMAAGLGLKCRLRRGIQALEADAARGPLRAVVSGPPARGLEDCVAGVEQAAGDEAEGPGRAAPAAVGAGPRAYAAAGAAVGVDHKVLNRKAAVGDHQQRAAAATAAAPRAAGGRSEAARRRRRRIHPPAAATPARRRTCHPARRPCGVPPPPPPGPRPVPPTAKPLTASADPSAPRKPPGPPSSPTPAVPVLLPLEPPLAPTLKFWQQPGARMRMSPATRMRDRRVRAIAREEELERAVDDETAEPEDAVRRQRHGDRASRARPGASGRARRIGRRIAGVERTQVRRGRAAAQVQHLLRDVAHRKEQQQRGQSCQT